MVQLHHLHHPNAALEHNLCRYSIFYVVNIEILGDETFFMQTRHCEHLKNHEEAINRDKVIRVMPPL